MFYIRPKIGDGYLIRTLYLLLSFIPTFLFAILSGNPADPSLKNQGLIISHYPWVSVRAAIFEDFVYRQRFQDEFKFDGCNHTPSFAKLSTNAGVLTLNLLNRFDLYGITGASRLELNREIYSRMQFSWGCGGKLVIVKTDCFFLGADVKYFETTQKSIYFVCEGLPFNVVNDFHLKYYEIQYALGIAFRSTFLSPYASLTYLTAKIEPQPMTALVRWPANRNLLIDAACKSTVTHRHFGLVVGTTILSNNLCTLSVESRMFNQNAININMDLRF